MSKAPTILRRNVLGTASRKIELSTAHFPSQGTKFRPRNQGFPEVLPPLKFFSLPLYVNFDLGLFLPPSIFFPIVTD